MTKGQIISALGQLGITMTQIGDSCQYNYIMPESIDYELAAKILPPDWVDTIRKAKETTLKPKIVYYGSKEHFNDIANGRD